MSVFNRTSDIWDALTVLSILACSLALAVGHGAPALPTLGILVGLVAITRRARPSKE